MVEDPGRQLATGSFHPIDDDEWEEDAYVHHASQADALFLFLPLFLVTFSLLSDLIL